MEHQVLVVDVSYKPVKVVPWEEAICRVLSDRFSVLDYSEKFVYSAQDKWFLPEIIVSPKSHRIRKKVKFDYDLVNARDNYVCAYCGEKYPHKYMTVDHIFPQHRGGKDSWENCITACKSCNNAKGGKTPEEAGMKLLYQPITPANTLELTLFHLKLKEEWMPYMPISVLNNIKNLKERTDYAQEVANRGILR
jgi:5-methylcytosine-specific restriction endonuclease McrA